MQLPLSHCAGSLEQRCSRDWPERLTNYTKYPYDKRREFAYHQGPDGLDA